jgi:lipopolysaccharide export system protein LptA
MTMRRMLGRLSCVAAAAIALGNAQAEPSGAPPNALQGFAQNRNQPVQINAQTLVVRDKSKVATYSGNVKLVQGDTTLRCKTLVIYYDSHQDGASVKAGPSGSQQIRRIEAIGNVIVTQRDQTATGEKAIYDTSDATVRLSPRPGGYVVVTQGPDILRGHSLIVHLDTGISHVEGGVETLVNPRAVKNPGPAAQKTAPELRTANSAANPARTARR